MADDCRDLTAAGGNEGFRGRMRASRLFRIADGTGRNVRNSGSSEPIANSFE
jgi:hypothetical protein